MIQEILPMSKRFGPYFSFLWSASEVRSLS